MSRMDSLDRNIAALIGEALPRVQRSSRPRLVRRRSMVSDPDPEPEPEPIVDEPARAATPSEPPTDDERREQARAAVLKRWQSTHV